VLASKGAISDIRRIRLTGSPAIFREPPIRVEVVDADTSAMNFHISGDALELREQPLDP
jgi:hypothetical protein